MENSHASVREEMDNHGTRGHSLQPELTELSLGEAVEVVPVLLRNLRRSTTVRTETSLLL